MSLVIGGSAAVAFSVFAGVLWILWRKRETRLSIRGKYVLVTGCDRGFGWETAVRLDKMGVCVLATCLTKEGEQSLKSATSEKLKTFLMDVTSSHQIGEIFYKVIELIDDKSGLWGLVNNAGVLCLGPAEWVPLADYKRTADVNLWGMIDVTKTFLPLVKKTKGRVVLVTSIAGVISPQVFSPYCVTKYAVEAFGDSLRREMRPFDVQVSIIEPGSTRTPLLVKSDVLTGRLRELWNKLSLEKQREYGKEYLEAVTKGVQDWCSSASHDVNQVIDSIVSSLTSQTPKSRYVIGRDAWQLKLSTHLPESLQDLLIKDFPFKPMALKSQITCRQ